MSGYNPLSFTKEGLKQRLSAMERSIADLERGGKWNYDDELSDAEIIARSGIGHLLLVAAVGDSIASGGDYLTFTSTVYKQGFPDGVSGQSVTWPASAVGEIQVDLTWATFDGGGKVEIEVDGTVPPFGLLADSSSGSEGSKRRGVHIAEGSAVKIKVTQESGSAEPIDAFVEFVIPDPTSTAFTVESQRITPGIAVSNNTDYVTAFFDETFTINWLGSRPVMLSNASDGTGSFYVDDKIVIDVTHPDASTASFSHTFGNSNSTITAAGPFDLSSYFEPGENSVRVRFFNVYPSHISSQEIWLVEL